MEHVYELTHDDAEYVKREFAPLWSLAVKRGLDMTVLLDWIAAGRMPRASYVLPVGTLMVPEDYFALMDAAGDVDSLEPWFRAQLDAECAAQGVELNPHAEWNGYLSGEHGATLRTVTPHNVVRKHALARSLLSLLADPRPDDDAWAAELRDGVDELDGLEREFTDLDRMRFHHPPTRDSIVAAARERFSGIWGGASS